MKKFHIILFLSLILNFAKAQQWTNYTYANGLVYNSVNAVAIDNNDIKWFGTADGLSKFDGVTWTNYTTANGLSGNVVRSIAVDSQNNKWLGTEDGYGYNCKIAKFNGVNWTIYSPSFLDTNSIWSIAIDAQNNKWFGTSRGVLKYDGTNWTTYTTSAGLLNYGVNAIAIDANGLKWFGTNGGLSMFDGTNWTNYTTANGIPINLFILLQSTHLAINGLEHRIMDYLNLMVLTGLFIQQVTV